MIRQSTTIAASRLQLALELFEAGVEMMRKTLHRRYPNRDDDEIKDLLVQWLRTRPGALYGDTVGHPVSWPRSRSNS